MADTLASILNWAIPLGIVLFFVFVLVSNPKIKHGLDVFVGWLKDAGSYLKAQASGKVEEQQEIVYG